MPSTTADPSSDDLLVFVDDDQGPGSPAPPAQAWRVLIVDDDEDVHATTLFSLQGVEVLGRPLSFLHAHSAQEARERLEREPEVAVVLLDVVMETSGAGLDLVSYLRNELGLADTRIILRTGQPGYAPEEQAIQDFDINDYKTKSELTRTKLITALTAAIRSYDQIRTIDAQRHGLETVVAAAGRLLEARELPAFAARLLDELAPLLGVPLEGLVALVAARDGGESPLGRVIAATPEFRAQQGRRVEQLAQPLREALQAALEQPGTRAAGDGLAAFLGEPRTGGLVLYLRPQLPLASAQLQLLDVFLANARLQGVNLRLLERLHDYAYVDQLLRLPNRAAFIDRLDRLDASGRLGWTVALIDLAEFAETNNLLGHRYGDQILRAVAERLRGTWGDRAFVARVAGDTFAVMGPDEVLLPEQLLQAFEQPFQLPNGLSHRVAAHAGLIRGDAMRGSGADVLKDASIALKQAKAVRSERVAFFTRELGSEIRDRADLMQSLREAFDRQVLFLHYQPQVDLASGRVVALEALLRWRDHDGRLIPPDLFIPLAENSGLMIALGAWVLRTACRFARQLPAPDGSPLRMAVNVSMLQFCQPDFAAVVEEALAGSGLPAERLELELTESIAMLGAPVVESNLRRLKALGVTIAVDDFGTGYSSLSLLDRLPFDCLKIDRAFVAQLDRGDGPRFAGLIVEIARKLGAQVLAEGIETAEQAEVLRGLGCGLGQGFHLGRPMADEELLEWLRRRGTPGAAS